MPLELHPITIEDCPAIATLYFEASAHRNLFNGTAQPAALQERFRQNLANTLNACAGEVMCQKRIFKVIDTDLAGKPISWGRWTIPDTENQASEEDETKIDPLQGPPIPGYNISLRAAFIKEIESMRARALKGTKHYCIKAPFPHALFDTAQHK
ncbi:hypothetical protein MMC14_009059 [Varicellaria rhodocarpa]|nr:hypothetical protein [Varicellaria rhodocarpa]